MLTTCCRSNEDLSRSVDLKVIKLPSVAWVFGANGTSDFPQDLLEREVCCVCTGIDEHIGFGDGVHVIPYRWCSKVSPIVDRILVLA